MRYRLSLELGIGEVIGHLIVWLILTVVTLGFAAFLFPYALGEKLLNRTVVIGPSGAPIGRLSCSAPLGARAIHALAWWVLTIISLGVAGVFYLYGVGRNLIDSTTLDLHSTP